MIPIVGPGEGGGGNGNDDDDDDEEEGGGGSGSGGGLMSRPPKERSRAGTVLLPDSPAGAAVVGAKRREEELPAGKVVLSEGRSICWISSFYYASLVRSAAWILIADASKWYSRKLCRIRGIDSCLQSCSESELEVVVKCFVVVRNGTTDLCWTHTYKPTSQN